MIKNCLSAPYGPIKYFVTAAGIVLMTSVSSFAGVISSQASLTQFGANCLAQGGSLSSHGGGSGLTCTKGNIVVFCTKVNAGQGPKAPGIICSVKGGGRPAAKLLNKLVLRPARSEGGRANPSIGNTQNSTQSGSG